MLAQGLRGGKPDPHQADEVIVRSARRQARQRRDVLQSHRLLAVLDNAKNPKGNFD